MIDEQVLLECIYDEELRLQNTFVLQDILKDLPTVKELLAKEYQKEKALICKHCNTPIKYDVHDCVYFHTIKNWGSDNVFNKNFNNGYWCDPRMGTSASPKEGE